MKIKDMAQVFFKERRILNEVLSVHLNSQSSNRKKLGTVLNMAAPAIPSQCQIH